MLNPVSSLARLIKTVMSPDHFVPPGPNGLADAESIAVEKVSYSKFNYLSPGFVSRIKRAHFDVALDMATRFAPAGDALDVGCADGIFLPTLSRNFGNVAAVDIRADMVQIARNVVRAEGLTNVVVEQSSVNAPIGGSFPGRKFAVAFCLETLEHAGDPADIYPSKLRLVEDIAACVVSGGAIVISVPVMTGVPFLVTRAGLRAFNHPREPLSTRELAAAIVGNTDALERRWQWGHLGFNERKLLEQLRTRFEVIEHADIFFQHVWTLRVV